MIIFIILVNFFFFSGSTEMGTIIDCEGYGSVESSTGGYVGGIFVFSSTFVRVCYAMC